MKLSGSEEILMNYLWRLEKAFFKDIMEQYPEPKPAITTINTLLKRLINKGVVKFKIYGNSREYYPVIKKNEYFKNQITYLIRNFFNNSSGQFASFFTEETELSDSELKELKKLVDEKLKGRKSNQ